MNDGINLRPWREELRQQRQKFFAQMAVLALFIGLGISALLWHLSNVSIDAKRQENALISAQMTILDQEIREVGQLREKREQLLHRIQVIQKLQHDRPVTLEVLNQFTASLTDGIYLTDVRRQGNQLLLQGLAQPSQAVSGWMRSLSQQPRFSEPVLRSLNANETSSAARFDLILPLREPQG